MKLLFTLVYFAGMVAEIIVRTPYERQRRQIKKTVQRITLAEKLIFAGLSVGMFLLPLVYALTPWLDFADYGLSPEARTIAGVVGALFLAAAVWVFWRSHYDLGANWSPTLEIGAQQTLITRGIYRTIRHPMYASQLLWGFAQALLLPNWLAGLASLGTFLSLYLIRVPREEQMMLEHFGDEYRTYSERTGRVLPKIK